MTSITTPGMTGGRGFSPGLAFVRYFIAEIENELPILAGEVLVGRLGCDWVVGYQKKASLPSLENSPTGSS